MKKFLLTLLMVILGITCILFVACDCSSGGADDGYIEDGEIVVGGDDLGSIEGKKVILNAQDIHIGLSSVKADVSSSAYVLENSIRIYTDIDLSAVNFGTAGVYDIKYVYGQESLAKKLYIYGLPTISGDESITVDYSRATTEIFDNLVAKDYFENDLDFQIFNANGMLDSDGSFNIGTFDTTIIAVDRAGQKASFNRSITVNEERNPIIDANYIFDVNEQSFSFELDGEDAEIFVGVSIDGKIVAPEYLTVDENVYTISNQFVYDYILNKGLVSDLVNGDDYGLTVLTVKGKSKAEFTVTDKQDVVYDLALIDNFITEPYACGVSVKVPYATLLNPYQKVTPVYTVIDKDNVRTTLSVGNSFVFDKDGNWTLEINLRGKIITKQLKAYYNLGLENGAIYGGDNPFTATLPDGYTLKEYSVSLLGKQDNLVLSCVNVAEIDTFKTAVHNLNAKNLYEMKVVAEKDGKTYSQKAMFGVVKNGLGVFANKDNSSDMTSINKGKTAINYTQKSVGGRTGVYEWKALTSNVKGSDDSMIIFSEAMKTELEKDYYLTFDIYYTGTISPVVVLSGKSIFLWDIYLVYDSEEQCIEVEKEKFDKDRNPSDISEGNFGGSLIRFFNEDGTEIVEDYDTATVERSVFLSATKKNQWITVEIKIAGEDLAKNAGIYTYSQVLDGKEVYFSNVRISSAPLMDDAVVNPVINLNNQILFNDIWK